MDIDFVETPDSISLIHSLTGGSAEYLKWIY